ncbi:MAG: tRNA preQ1(34) S-adenosylmethionine ribosyltransferase-isomerase QueA [Myxococcota bacterium]|nr:tRNA preQ1(34) S-adenosylmethionine ribosyltransferase-isomerase QueA [Myxococcota bacterium]MDW8363841.1 tRNA preQ1(34) S-adenosylmethionine ribosyltransferase-isomerase QueA [Myxococcales bacterium]
MRIEDLDYELPEELIAQRPLPERDAARLLVLDPWTARIEHRTVRDLPELLPPSLFVFNDSRVLPARLRGRRPGGGRVELLLVERIDPAASRERWVALARPSSRLAPGMELSLAAGALRAELLDRTGTGAWHVALHGLPTATEAVERHGEVPLPPYVRRSPDDSDRDRYQTVYARTPGSVAAPTAGLHFTERLLAALRAAGHQTAFVTLHVGPGTFAPLRAPSLDAHRMHAERFEISEAAARAVAQARAENRAVVAVGTTVVRTLESAACGDGHVRPGSASTHLFIRPPHRFAVVDALLTNFHLPRSTLLALVMALGGVKAVRAAYAEAVARRYRFYSYGDAMLVLPGPHSARPPHIGGVVAGCGSAGRPQ